MLPVVNKNYGPFGDSTGMELLVARPYLRWLNGARPRHLLLEGSSRTAWSTGRSASMASRRSGSGRTADLPDGWVGSAIVVSDQPVVVVANVESEVFTGDRVLTYGGVSIE